MSALAQLIEARGIPTTVLGLVRPHMEKVGVPRGIWTPFQLGRPVGEPADAAFQKRVLTAALKLLERTDGPSIIVDFPEEQPSLSERAGWKPPVSLPAPASPANPSEWAAALQAEMALVAPHWEKARLRNGRTTVGVSSQPPYDWPGYMAQFLDGKLPVGPTPHLAAPALALRFAIDDLKAFYSEAAQADGPNPASRQIDLWFWRETLAGKLIQALRVAAMASSNNALSTVGGRFFVPAPYLVK